MGQRGRSLSGGQRQRIALSRALLRSGQVLVLDEPTTGLDPEASVRLVQQLRSGSRAVVMITHDHSLTRYADRVLRLDQGQVVR
jgi:ABC-type bacteriocin/lantibiotic exporter with double-glycine peptidase domain